MTESLRKRFGRFFAASPAGWVWAGFLLSYLFFFLYPTFFSAPVMQFFQDVPANAPIGVDLAQLLDYCRSWAVLGQSPYVGNNLYPPMATVVFAPLLSLEYSTAYRVLTLLSLAGLIATVGLVPFGAGESRPKTALWGLALVTGLFSYGFQFELERGQFNVIAVGLSFLAIWIYHRRPGARLLAYLLFTLAVQLKLYPLIFAFFLVDSEKRWRENLKALSLLALANLGFLFILGPAVFVDFLKSVLTQSVYPYVWVQNHSIRSFAALLAQNGLGSGWGGIIQWVLLAVVAVCILWLAMQAYARRQKGVDPFLLMACTLGALLIPAQSHDYTLALLVAPAANLLVELPGRATNAHPAGRRFGMNVLVLIFSVGYSATLFSYTHRPPFLASQTPLLILLLLATAGLALILPPNPVESSHD